MITRKELDYLDYLLKERLPEGKRTACAILEELGFGDNIEHAHDRLTKLSMRGMIDYVPPLEKGGFAIITRRPAPKGDAVLKSKRRKPRDLADVVLYNPALRGA